MLSACLVELQLLYCTVQCDSFVFRPTLSLPASVLFRAWIVYGLHLPQNWQLALNLALCLFQCVWGCVLYSCHRVLIFSCLHFLGESLFESYFRPLKSLCVILRSTKLGFICALGKELKEDKLIPIYRQLISDPNTILPFYNYYIILCFYLELYLEYMSICINIFLNTYI